MNMFAFDLIVVSCSRSNNSDPLKETLQHRQTFYIIKLQISFSGMCFIQKIHHHLTAIIDNINCHNFMRVQYTTSIILKRGSLALGDLETHNK